MNKVQDINFTPRVKRALDVAKQRCLENNWHEITDEFLLHAILFSESMIVNLAFQSVKIEIKDVVLALSKTLPTGKKKVSEKNVNFSSSAKLIVDNSYKISQSFKQNYTGVEHLFLSILRHSPSVAKFFKKHGLDIAFFADKVEKECKHLSNPVKKPIESQQSKSQDSLSEFCEDFNEKALAGEFDHISFREKEVAQLSEVLCRKQKRNPILIGHPGVGKSAVVGLIAKKIISCQCTEFLLNKKIISVNLSALIAGTKLRGEFEERLTKVMEQIKKIGNVIVFIDEVHNLIGLGNDAGSMDGANILKSYLTCEDMSFIGATTEKEYEAYFAKDAAMNRRFEPVFIKEPNKEQTLDILKNLKGYYESFHMILYPDSVLVDIVNVCDKYITSKYFPDKAIDLMDQVGAKVKIKAFARPQEIKNMEKLILEFEKIAPDDIKEEHLDDIIEDYQKKYDAWADQIKNKKEKAKTKDVYQALSDKIGKVIDMESENSGIKNIYSNLKKHVFGQDDAVKKISDCILRSSFGLAKNSRPLGNFMFIGPTGSGKTHLAKTLAKEAFGSDSNLCIVDMSEFMESHAVSKLIGAPPGYVGHKEPSIFFTQLQKHPSTVFLFDEIEKAHPDVVNILLQIMDRGELTDSVGNKLNFKNSIVIMTGNVGFQINDNKRMGFGAISNPKPTKDSIMDSLKKFFRPEFLARLNEVVIFQELSTESLIKVIETELDFIKTSLANNGTTISFSSEIIDYVIDKTKDSNSGARKVVFFIENELKTKIVDVLSTAKYNQIKVSVKNGEIQVDGKTKKLLATCDKK
jgi:ATP-dependent Clp protease ATP-binding subunit ClpC